MGFDLGFHFEFHRGLFVFNFRGADHIMELVSFLLSFVDLGIKRGLIDGDF
jgi:hypothetical protein